MSRMVADVDALQSLYLRGLGRRSWPSSPGPRGRRRIRGAAARRALAHGRTARGRRRRPDRLGVAGSRDRPLPIGGPRTPGRGARRHRPRSVQALVVYGREEESIRRLRATDAMLARLARETRSRPESPTGSGSWWQERPRLRCSPSPSPRSSGDLDRVLVAALVFLALASFEAVAPLPLAARELSRRLPPAGVCSSSLIVSRWSRILPRQSRHRGHACDRARGRERALPGRRRARARPLQLESSRVESLVRPSGAGKTTVVNLLLRFLDPVAGRVTLGDHDLREYRQEDVRRALAVAGQDSYLFSTSIRENVRLGRPEATDVEVDDALRQARLADWVASLPDGPDTLVGEEGVQLSVGQRQRVALARAFLSDAPILVIDEPTAHLDPDGRSTRPRRARGRRREVRRPDHAPPGGPRPRRRGRVPG